jgi:hypothetical protein
MKIKGIVIGLLLLCCVSCNTFVVAEAVDEVIDVFRKKESTPDFIVDTDTRPLTAVIKVYNDEGNFVE